jgi:hypothetical protein
MPFIHPAPAKSLSIASEKPTSLKKINLLASFGNSATGIVDAFKPPYGEIPNLSWSAGPQGA